MPTAHAAEAPKCAATAAAVTHCIAFAYDCARGFAPPGMRRGRVWRASPPPRSASRPPAAPGASGAGRSARRAALRERTSSCRRGLTRATQSTSTQHPGSSESANPEGRRALVLQAGQKRAGPAWPHCARCPAAMSASRVPEARALAAAFAASVASPATPVSGLVRTSGGAPEPGSALPSLRGLIAAKTAELAAASEARLSAVTTRLRCAARRSGNAALCAHAPPLCAPAAPLRRSYVRSHRSWQPRRRSSCSCCPTSSSTSRRAFNSLATRSLEPC